jgi:hypothetical protein
MNKLFCPGNAILAGFSGSVALCPFSAISGPQDGNFSSLARRKAIYQITHDGA